MANPRLIAGGKFEQAIEARLIVDGEDVVAFTEVTNITPVSVRYISAGYEADIRLGDAEIVGRVSVVKRRQLEEMRRLFSMAIIGPWNRAAVKRAKRARRYALRRDATRAIRAMHRDGHRWKSGHAAMVRQLLSLGRLPTGATRH